VTVSAVVDRRHADRVVAEKVCDPNTLLWSGVTEWSWVFQPTPLRDPKIAGILDAEFNAYTHTDLHWRRG